MNHTSLNWLAGGRGTSWVTPLRGSRALMFWMVGWILLLAPAAMAEDEVATVEKRLLDSVSYLASEECEGRGPGTPGIDAAADYIKTQFETIGLQTNLVSGGPYQPFAIEGGAQVGEQTAVRLVGPGADGGDPPAPVELALGSDFSPLGNSGSGEFDLPLVFAGYGLTLAAEGYDDYQDLDVQGKAVIVLRHRPQQGAAGTLGRMRDRLITSLQNKVATAEKHGAACVVFCTNDAENRSSLDRLRRRWQEALDWLTEKHQALKAVEEPTPEQIEAQRQEIAKLIEAVQRTADELAVGYDPLLQFPYGGTRGAQPKVPVFHCRRATIDRILKQAADTDLATLEHQIDSDQKPHSLPLADWRIAGRVDINRQQTQVKNVVAMLPGAGPHADEAIVIGAHYDHLGLRKNADGTVDLYNGADDNASGVAAMLEIARQLAAAKNPPGRDIVFVAFTAEERGLLGSRHYVEHPVVPLDKTVAMLNLDMVGRLRQDRLSVYGTGTGSGFDELLDRLDDKCALQLAKQPSGIGPSDHASFCRQEVPVLFFITGTHADLHKVTDDVEKINVPGMRRVVSLVEEVAVELAQAESRPTFQTVASGRGGRRAFLGIAAAEEQDGQGLVIGTVTADGPAAQAGIQNGDVITKLGDTKITELDDLLQALRGLRPGRKVQVTLLRDQKEVTLDVTLGSP